MVHSGFALTSAVWIKSWRTPTPTPHLWPPWQPMQGQNLLKNQPPTYVPLGLNPWRWQMETAFQTHYSSFKWDMMPFGLTNTPAVFHCFMNDIFGDLLDVCILVYLDNILIYSNSKEEHNCHIWEILQYLWQHNLYVCTNKCFFHVSTVEYLGYILSPSSLTMASNKVQVIQDWPKPQKIKTFSPSWVLPISIGVLFWNTLRSLFHSPTSPTKELLGISAISATLPSHCWTKPSPLHQS